MAPNESTPEIPQDQPPFYAGSKRMAVIRVGEGRGFVVNGRHTRLVITAAHCLPELPTGFGIGYAEERTYADLLGRLGKDATVCAECLFVDPIADIAVLGSPDNQALPDEADAYEALVNAAATLSVNAVPSERDAEQLAWMLSLDGQWLPCDLHHVGGPWFAPHFGKQDSTVGGMSGSPILDGQGMAIGIVATGAGPHPRLCCHLPVGLLADMIATSDEVDSEALARATDAHGVVHLTRELLPDRVRRQLDLDDLRTRVEALERRATGFDLP